MSNPKPATPILEAPSRFERFWTLVLAACLGVVFVVMLNVFPFQIKDVELSRILIDWEYRTDSAGRFINQRHPLSVQAVMWLAMFVGIGELWIRSRALRVERAVLRYRLLPEDERSLLTVDDLRPIYLKARGISKSLVLPVLVRRLTMEFRKSKSIDRVNAIQDSSLELFLHQLDLRYTLIR